MKSSRFSIFLGTLLILSVFIVSASFAGVPDAYEPDNSYLDATYHTASSTQTHSIVPDTDTDWMVFSIGQESNVTIETTGPLPADTRMWLYNIGLSQIDYNDDKDTGLFSRIEKLLDTGTYYVKIDEYNNNNEIDEYQIYLAVTPVAYRIIYVDDDWGYDPGPGDPGVSDPDEDGTSLHPFDAIQEGIDAANNGDKVIVISGTYTGTGNKEIDFGGKTIIVKARNLYGTSTIDCQGSGRGFIFNSGESPASILDGFAIRNGSATEGGGIYCSSNPTIRSCDISDCSADTGGGIYVLNADPDITDCTIEGNQASSGGGIYALNSSPDVSRCFISENSAITGGGIHSGGGITITECAIIQNYAENCGGILCTGASNATISNCAIIGNSGASGGGVSFHTSTGIISNCLIRENFSPDFGGGVYCGWASPDLTIINCNIVNNSAEIRGAGIACDYSSNATVTNCILWENLAPEGHEISIATATQPSTVTVSYSDVQGDTADIAIKSGCVLNWGAGNIDQDPMLMPMAGFVQRLLPGSPCIDRGSSDLPAPLYDMEGRFRWNDVNTNDYGAGSRGSYWDIGTYEFNGFYVNKDTGSDTQDGQSPIAGSGHGPKKTIQAAIDAASDGDVVSVAEGIYTGTGNKDLDFTGKHITLISAGATENTIIDCEGSGRGFFFHSSEDRQAVLDGFMITNGDVGDSFGGGIYCYESDPTIRNCTITFCNANYDGGGVFCDNAAPVIQDCVIQYNSESGIVLGPGSDATITGCEITDNQGDFFCGGIYAYGSRADISDCFIANNTGISASAGIFFEDALDLIPVIRNCTIVNNTVGSYGGGIYCMWSHPIISNCIIMENRADTYGGGIYLEVTSEPTIINCIIGRNGALNKGGGIVCTGGSDPTIINSVIVQNYSEGTGGGIYCKDGNPIAVNSILWGNGPNQVAIDSGTPELQYCDIEGGWGGSGGNNIDADPMFVYSDESDYRLLPGSPCIDAGTSDGAPEVDFGGRPRYDAPVIANTGGGAMPYYDIGVHESRVWFVSNQDGNDSFNGLFSEDQSDSENGPKKTIQAGINASSHHDAVVVAAGTYRGEGNRDLEYGGREIILTSSTGAERTVIDCEGDTPGWHRGVNFISGETERSVLRGFTIINGYHGGGGAIASNTGCNPTILNCNFFNNKAYYGGAINCFWGGATIANCVFDDNHVFGAMADGGAIEVYYADPTIKNCLITNNTADRSGGGVEFYSGNGKMINCTLSGNSAGLFGGGLFVASDNPEIYNSIVWDNAPEGIYVWGVTPTIEYCDVQGGTGKTWFGTGCIDLDPLFVSGARHDYYLSQIASGQSSNSPCVDTGSGPAADLGLAELSTRRDGAPDEGIVDMGYHVPYALWIDSLIVQGNNVIIHWNGLPGVSYAIIWSEDLESWNETSAGIATSWTHINGAPKKKVFYRVREE